jgi:bifunctional ADP-heptose synthase (sugar kinase/adenylyltransferase)
MLIHNQDQTSKLVITDRLPALNKAPRDVSGAGDAALITSAMAIAAGATIWEAGIFGSVAASIQVSRVGNQPILMEELLEALQK